MSAKNYDLKQLADIVGWILEPKYRDLKIVDGSYNIAAIELKSDERKIKFNVKIRKTFGSDEYSGELIEKRWLKGHETKEVVIYKPAKQNLDVARKGYRADRHQETNFHNMRTVEDDSKRVFPKDPISV